MASTSDIEKKRLELEKEQVKLDLLRARHGDRFFNKHFGAIITTVVSIAAVGVSLSQIKVAEIQRQREIEVQQLESDRQWRIKAAEFIAENKDAIFSKNDQERQIIRNVIGVAFPKEISGVLLFEVRKKESGQVLLDYWQPVGSNINQENETKLRDWMEKNDFDTGPGSIPIFLYAEQNEGARLSAATDLGLRNKKQTFTNIPDSFVDVYEQDLLMGGASSVVKTKQTDGLWTITASYVKE